MAVTTMTTFPQSRRDTARLVDRIGGSDSFAAGLIHGFVGGRDLEATLKFAVVASALKQTSSGDAALRPRVFQKESS